MSRSLSKTWNIYDKGEGFCIKNIHIPVLCIAQVGGGLTGKCQDENVLNIVF